MNSRNLLPVLSLLCLWQLDLELNEVLHDETVVCQQLAENVSDTFSIVDAENK